MVKREVKRNVNRFGRLFEPFAIFLLILLFTVPVFAVINLSPQTGNPPQTREDVLGISVTPGRSIELVGGSHDFITEEKLFDESDTLYRYQATVVQRESGVYSKPVLVVTNPTDGDMKVVFTLVRDEASNSQLGLMVDDINYVIRASNGEKFLREFNLRPGEEMVFYLDVRNAQDQNFEESIELKVDFISLQPPALIQEVDQTEVEPMPDSETEDIDQEEEIEDEQLEGATPEGEGEVYGEQIDTFVYVNE